MNDLRASCRLCQTRFRIATAAVPIVGLDQVLEVHWLQQHPFELRWLDYWEEKAERAGYLPSVVTESTP